MAGRFERAADLYRDYLHDTRETAKRFWRWARSASKTGNWSGRNLSSARRHAWSQARSMRFANDMETYFLLTLTGRLDGAASLMGLSRRVLGRLLR